MASLMVPGYEADDLVGSIAWRAVDEGMAVTIVSIDKARIPTLLAASTSQGVSAGCARPVGSYSGQQLQHWPAPCLLQTAPAHPPVICGDPAPQTGPRACAWQAQAAALR